MNKLYLIDAIYFISAPHSNILCKKEFFNSSSLTACRSQKEIRRIKNLCLDDEEESLVPIEEGSTSKALNIIVNDVVFMFIVNVAKTQFGTGLSQLYECLRSLVSVLRMALNKETK